MKVRVTAAVLLTVLLGMVACGEKATPEPVATGTDAPAATATPEPTVTAPPEPVASATPTTAATEPPPTATETAEPTATKTPTPEGVVRFEEGRCPFSVPADRTVTCGYVVVPEDHTKPDGPTIRLAVAVIKSRSPHRQPDPVLLLSGGPGEKTVANGLAVVQIMAPELADRDFVIFDQRGAGLSEPALECPEWERAQFDILDEADTDASARTVFEALMACRDRLVADGHNLAAYNTLQNAADVNAIRVALGYDQVNLYGGSYGSLLAQAVLRDHPEGIRSVVLWSVLPLEKSLLVESSATTAKAVMHLLDACAADPACNNAYPELQGVLFDVIERLNAEPVMINAVNPADGKSYDALLTGDGTFANLALFLYQTEIIPLLPQAIYEVYDGDYALMAQLRGRNLAFIGLMSRGMTYSVLCTDDLIGQTPEEYLNIMAALPLPLEGPSDPELAIELGIFGVCENWPVEEAEAWVKAPLASDIPTLMLEGEYDPVTPPEYAHMVARHLSNSTVLEFPNIGHNIIVASDCARSIAAEFLNDPTRVPDATCITTARAGFATQYQDPAGMFSVPVFPGWTVEEADGLVILTSPADELTVSVLAVEGDDLGEGARVAWARIDPAFDRTPRIRERRCVGCAAANVEKFALLDYGVGNDGKLTLAAGWLYEGVVYLQIWQADPTVFEQQGGTLDILATRFVIHTLTSVQ